MNKLDRFKKLDKKRIQLIVDRHESRKAFMKAHGLHADYRLELSDFLASVGICISHWEPDEIKNKRNSSFGLKVLRDKKREVFIEKTLPHLFIANSPIDGKRARAIIRSWNKDFNWLPEICECGNKGEWRGKKLTLQIDHRNGDNSDHRLENLRFLCPNCHSQTETYTGKNIGRRKNKSVE